MIITNLSTFAELQKYEKFFCWQNKVLNTDLLKIRIIIVLSMTSVNVKKYLYLHSRNYAYLCSSKIVS